jgi:hypothetical protein
MVKSSMEAILQNGHTPPTTVKRDKMTKTPQIPGIDGEQELKAYRLEINQLLVQYGNIKESEVERLIDQSGLFAGLDTEDALLHLFHEEPYYWAMELLYASQNRQWYLDPTLWPPPEHKGG